MTGRSTLIVFTREPVAGETKPRLIPKLGTQNTTALAHAFTLERSRQSAKPPRSNIKIAGSARYDARRAAYFRTLARRFDARRIDQTLVVILDE